MELAKRSEVPAEYTWDLTAIFPDKAALQAAMDTLRQLADEDLLFIFSISGFIACTKPLM